MAFRTRKSTSVSFATPQEMFQDNKLKKIKGILDYQSKMIDQYLTTIENERIKNKNVAFELPTGSGKTLVGILIAEFHRRKHHRRCLYLCPTNQLVSQVCAQAKDQYGIHAIPFIGRQAEYDTTDKTAYNLCDAIGVTTYSSFFALPSFFSQVDILIFDDVHSSEDYIINNWSLSINRMDHPALWSQLVETLKDVIGVSGMARINSEDSSERDANEWNDLIPRPLLLPKLSVLHSIIDAGVSDYSLRYAWSRISDNLIDCQFYISRNELLIRPYIPPTNTHDAFKNAKQRIFMSATLGNSGELERLTGCKDIRRLPIVNDWDKKGIGRRLFIFPDLSFSPEQHNKIIAFLHNTAHKSVLIVPTTKESKQKTQEIQNLVEGIQIFDANDLIKRKSEYQESDNAMVIMASRFDGIDFPDDDSRMLFIYNLPKATHLQEKFFIGKMSANLLFAERIKTRIIQAVGRCTRNASDYSVVCVLGSSIQNEIVTPEIQRTYPPELRAEIAFGVDNSKDLENIDSILENVRFFLSRSPEWAETEPDIVERRDSFIAEGPDTTQSQLYQKLLTSAEFEVELQYALWHQDYQTALEKCTQIINVLNAPSLSGYKCFWQYMHGCYALELGMNDVAAGSFKDANKNNAGSVKWFSKLIQLASVEHGDDVPEDSSKFLNIIESLENNLLSYLGNNRFETTAKRILEGLNSKDGTVFEREHLHLYRLLGYNSENASDPAAPDPYWIVDDDLCVVAEDKIYESSSKEIPVKDVKQAAQHIDWIKQNEHALKSDARIITILISNSEQIEDSARPFCRDIYYVNRDDFYRWAISAIDSIRSVLAAFHESGNYEWRQYAMQCFKQNKTDPDSFIRFIQQKRLSCL